MGDPFYPLMPFGMYRHRVGAKDYSRPYLPMPTSLQVVEFFRIVVEDSIFGLLANVGLLF